MWEDLGISCGTFIVVMIVLYFVIRGAVKGAILSAYREISAARSADDDGEPDETDKDEE